MAFLLFDPAKDDWTPDKLVKRAPAQPVAIPTMEQEDEILAEAKRIIEGRIAKLQDQLDTLSPSIGGKPRARAILTQVALRSGYTVDDLKGPYRNENIVLARHEAYYRIRTETTLSYTAIAKIIGRDHTTIMAGVRKHAMRNNLPMPGERAKKNA